MTKIATMSKKLRLANVRQNYEVMIKEAVANHLSYHDFLVELLTQELAARRVRAIERKMQAAQFPYVRSFAELDWDAFAVAVVTRIRELQSLAFISAGQNVIFVGNPGVGKTHLALALGLMACEANYSVLFVKVPNLILELKEAFRERDITAYKKRFMQYDLVILDELGYISFDQDGSELLFNLLSNRAEQKAIMVTTNLTFDKWPNLFGDTLMTTALVDRLTNKAHIIQITGDSYRIKQTQAWLQSK